MGHYKVNINLNASVIVTGTGRNVTEKLETQVADRIKIALADSGVIDSVHIKVEAKCYGIMNTTNGHNKELVEKVNQAYNQQLGLFEEIVTLLAKRDSCEMMELGIDVFSINAEFNEIAHYYCQRVADDWDLETIIKYCRI